MQTALKRIGNSAGVIIPKPILSQLGLSAGDPVDLSTEDGALVVRAARGKPRQGWAEDAALIAKAPAHEDEAAWDALAGEESTDWRW